jgi:hypothetical protein
MTRQGGAQGADGHPSLPVVRTPVTARPTLDKAILSDKPTAPGPKIIAVTPAGTANGGQSTLPVQGPRAREPRRPS